MRHTELHPVSGPETRCRWQRNTSRGQGLAEMALVTPLLLICLFGVVEMGRLFYSWVTVQHAARTGARVAITGRGEQEGNRLNLIIKATKQETDQLYGGDATIIVRSWSGVRANGPGRLRNPGAPCDLVEVEVQYAYRPVVPLIGELLPSGIILTGKDRKLNEPWMPCGP